MHTVTIDTIDGSPTPSLTEEQYGPISEKTTYLNKTGFGLLRAVNLYDQQEL